MCIYFDKNSCHPGQNEFSFIWKRKRKHKFQRIENNFFGIDLHKNFQHLFCFTLCFFPFLFFNWKSCYEWNWLLFVTEHFMHLALHKTIVIQLFPLKQSVQQKKGNKSHNFSLSTSFHWAMTHNPYPVINQSKS